MAFVKIRVPRTSQPQDACGIDRANAFGENVVFSSPDGLRSQDRVATRIGTVTQKPTVNGIAAEFNGTSWVEYGTKPIIQPNSAFTISLYEETAVVGTFSSLFSIPVGSNQFIFIRGTNGEYTCAVGIAGGSGGYQFAGAGSQTAGEKIRFVITGSNISDRTTYKLWANGVKHTGIPKTFGSLAAQSIKIGWDGADTKFNGLIQDVLFLDREVSDEEAIAITANPWQIFEPEEQLIWVPDAVGAGGPATVIPIGVQANSAIGTPAAIGAAIAALTGVSATGSVGSPTATGGASIPATASPSGVSASSAVGTPAAKGAAKALPAGVQATSAVGTPLVIGGSSIPATVLPAGVAGLAYVGSPVATGQARAYPLGVQATGAVGSPVVTAGGSAVAQPQGVAASSSVGAPVARGAAVAYPLGLAGYWSVGQPVAIGQSAMPATAYPAGVSATGYVGTPVAFEVSDATPSIHRAISPAQSYTATSPAQSYTATSPAQSYTAVVPAQIYST